MDIDELLDSLEIYQLRRREYYAKLAKAQTPAAAYWLSRDRDEMDEAQERFTRALDAYILERIRTWASKPSQAPVTD